MAGGRFADALKDVDAAIAMKPPAPAWLAFNLAVLRGLIAAHLGDAKTMRDDLERALAFGRDRQAVALPHFAWPSFLAGDFKASAEAAAAAAVAAPRQAEPALFAHVTSLRAGATGSDKLAAAAAALDAKQWPYPVVEVFLGRRAAAAALAAAEVPGDAAQSAARACIAHFYLAQHAIGAGDAARAEAHLRGIRETCRGDEYMAAWAALEHARTAARK